MENHILYMVNCQTENYWIAGINHSNMFFSLTPVIVYFIIFSSQKELLSD